MSAAPKAPFFAYLSLARFDNWTKNAVMLIGAWAAYALMRDHAAGSWLNIVFGMLSLCFASSANYTLNETVDRRFDSHHPLKRQRSAVRYALDRRVITVQYAIFSLAALSAGLLVDSRLCVTVAAYLICALAYNLPPLRLKDRAYADILLESVNYPLRLLVGWQCLLPVHFPPVSMLILGWSIGGFAMSVKRLAEYQRFNSPEEAARYRKSYRTYDLAKLASIALLCAMLCAFGITVLLLKYHIEFLLALPLIGLWFMYYFLLGMRSDLHIIYPEQLLGHKPLTALSLVIILALIVLARLHWPELHWFEEPLYFGAARASGT